MSCARAGWTVAVLAVFQSRVPIGEAAFSKLSGGARCWDYHIPDVSSKELCFNTAASALGLNSLFKMQLDGIGFNGCAINTAANLLIYSVSPGATAQTSVALPTLEYICNGVGSTTVTSTATSTTTSGVFAKLEPGSRCWDQGVPDVPSKEMCFETAVHFVDLGGASTVQLDNVGFSGCVYNSAAKVLMYGSSPWVTPATSITLPTFHYVCNGIPTTTTTTTATATSTTSTSVTATTTTMLYTKLTAGTRCADGGRLDVGSKAACFGAAAAGVGLGGSATKEIDGIGFTGCIFNSAAGLVIWGVTPWATPQTNLALPTFEYICKGPPATVYP